jgi:hypothetical protein
MLMQMHMVELMMGISDSTTVMGMIPFNDYEMHMEQGDEDFRTHNEGVGDISASLLQSLYSNDTTTAVGAVGMSFPSGDDTSSDVYRGVRMADPYHMKIGSGTFDLLPQFTLKHRIDAISIGAQIGGAVRLWQADEEYRMGHRATVSTWVVWAAFDWSELSFRLEGQAWGDVAGSDTTIMGTSASRDPDEQAGSVLAALPGITLVKRDGPLKGHRLGVELGVPLTQDVDSGLPEEELRVIVAWQVGL